MTLRRSPDTSFGTTKWPFVVDILGGLGTAVLLFGVYKCADIDSKGLESNGPVATVTRIARAVVPRKTYTAKTAVEACRIRMVEHDPSGVSGTVLGRAMLYGLLDAEIHEGRGYSWQEIGERCASTPDKDFVNDGVINRIFPVR